MISFYVSNDNIEREEKLLGAEHTVNKKKGKEEWQKMLNAPCRQRIVLF